MDRKTELALVDVEATAKACWSATALAVAQTEVRLYKAEQYEGLTAADLYKAQQRWEPTARDLEDIAYCKTKTIDATVQRKEIEASLSALKEAETDAQLRFWEALKNSTIDNEN